jgi:membrane protein YdbS with pleckstrin-like domain
VPDLIIRPTAKFLKAGALLTALVFLAAEIAYLAYWRGNDKLAFVPLVAPLLFIWPGVRWLRWRSTKTVIAGDRLRYETGLAAKSTRTIQLSKLQDVRVDQGLRQRVFNIGNISMETSGEASRLTIPNVDRPQAVADELMNRSQHGTYQPGAPQPGTSPYGTAEGAKN